MDSTYSSKLPILGDGPPIRRTALLRQISAQRDPPVNTVSDIREYMKLFRQKHNKELDLNKHDKAQEVYRMMTAFSNHATRSLFNRRCKSALSSLGDKMHTTETNEAAFDDQTTEYEKNFEAETQIRWDRMKARHEREMQTLMDEMPVETPANFRRRSPALLAMVRQEKRLFCLSQFDEAERVRKDCERREKQEATAQHDEAMRHWNIKKKHLLDKQKREEDAMKEWILQRRAEYKIHRDSQQQALQKRKTLLGNQMENTSIINRSATPHFIRRNICFDIQSKPSRTIQSTPESEHVDKIYLTMTDKSHEILQRL